MQTEDYFLFALIFFIVFLGSIWNSSLYRGLVEIGECYTQEYDAHSFIRLNLSVFIDIMTGFPFFLGLGFTIAGVIKYRLSKFRRKE